MPKIISSKDHQALEKALEALKRGRVVAIPTETFYGLAVDYRNEKALKRLFILKKRPEEKPVLLLIGDLTQLNEIVQDVPSLARNLIERFWPGPLTLVLPARPHLSFFLTAGTGKVAVRLSSHQIPLQLAQALGRPITGTSANLSGRPPARTPAEILAQLPEVDLIIDAGALPAEAPSTIVEVSGESLRLLREGEIPWREICKIIDKGLRQQQKGV